MNGSSWLAPGAAALLLLAAACSKRETDAPQAPAQQQQQQQQQQQASTGCPTIFTGEPLTTVRFSPGTSAGMHGLWKPSAFASICGVDDWKKRFERDEDIEASIAAGSFVPLNINADGAPSIELRIGTAAAPAALSAGESGWRKATSKPYLFASDGLVSVSGIEHVGGRHAGDTRTLALAPGRWQVNVHYLEAPQGAERPPDFLVLLNPLPVPGGGGTLSFRRSVETFDITMR